jgi:hypothetical protein
MPRNRQTAAGGRFGFTRFTLPTSSNWLADMVVTATGRSRSQSLSNWKREREKAIFDHGGCDFDAMARPQASLKAGSLRR